MESNFYCDSCAELFSHETKPSSDVALEAQKAIAFLFSATPWSGEKISKRFSRALFSKPDRELCHAVFLELETIISKIYVWLDAGREVAMCELLLARILALIPFLEPEKGSQVAIPVKIGSRYNLIHYRFEPVELSPKWLGSPLLAQILRPESNDAPLLLLFMGTPAPTISGFFLSVWTDFVPGFAVGELAFRLFVRRRVRALLKTCQEKAILYGHSLGGALALLSACECGDRVARVEAFGAPVPHKRSTRKFDSPATVNLYWYEGDIVPFVGRTPHPEWKQFVIRGDMPQAAFLAHLRPLPALEPLSVSRVAYEEPCGKRREWTAIHFLVSIPLFAILTGLLGLRSVWVTLKNFVWRGQ